MPVCVSCLCLVVAKRKPTLEFALRGILDGLLDVVVRRGLLDAAGQVNNGDVGSRHTHGHASELAVKVGDDLADGLCGTCGAGDNVLRRATATAPVLAGRAVDGLLGGSVRVDGGHQTLNHVELLVDDLGERRQAVGRARGVGQNLNVGLVGLLVHAHDEHGGVGRWRRNDNLLCTALQVGLGLLRRGEDTSGLNNVVCASLGPGDVGRVTLLVEAHLLAVDGEIVAIDRNLALEAAVGGVVLEHVCLANRSVSDYPAMMAMLCINDKAYRIVRLDEGIVDSYDINVAVLDTASFGQ
jgi:hypothetical protein